MSACLPAPAAAFLIRYTLEGSTVFVSMDSIEEREGYELIEAGMPRLATVREEDGLAWLAHGEEGGSLVALSEATPGQLPPNRFWGKVLATLPVVMIGTERAMCVLEVTAYMDGTEMAVAGGTGRRRAIESFRREGEKTIIGLEGNSYIDLDWQNKTYSVSVDGAEIARDGNTFCPVDGERLAFYSLAGDNLSAPLPESWNAADIAAVGLSIDKPNEIKVTVENGKIEVQVPPQQPVMVYRDGAAAKTELRRAR